MNFKGTSKRWRMTKSQVVWITYMWKEVNGDIGTVHCEKILDEVGQFKVVIP
jgi:hypothetical protein